MQKTTKRIVALFVALIMTFIIAIPTFADTPTITSRKEVDSSTGYVTYYWSVDDPSAQYAYIMGSGVPTDEIWNQATKVDVGKKQITKSGNYLFMAKIGGSIIYKEESITCAYVQYTGKFSVTVDGTEVNGPIQLTNKTKEIKVTASAAANGNNVSLDVAAPQYPIRFIEGTYSQITDDLFNSASATTNNTYPISKEGTYTVIFATYKTSEKQVLNYQYKTITVTGNVDAIQPVIKVKKSEALGNGKFSFEYEITDNVGVAEVRLATGKNATFDSGKVIKNYSFVLDSKDGTDYVLYAKDTAGNISSSPIEIGHKSETIQEQCKDGYVYDETSKACVKKTSTVEIRCPEGSTWNEVEKRCERPTTCPDGYIYSDFFLSCIKITCGEGYTWNEETEMCEMTDCPVCEPTCIEPYVYNPETGKCEVETCPDGYFETIYGDCITCPEGLVFDGANDCVCPDGQLPNSDGSCGTTPTCPDGQIMTSEGECVCPDGTPVKEDGTCGTTITDNPDIPTIPDTGCKEEITCPEGQYFDTNACICKPKITKLPQTGGIDIKVITMIISLVAMISGVGIYFYIKKKK